MLQELRITDFAIIDRLELSFAKGLTILSGETGAGKSIIVGALALLMGGRSTAEMIRTSRDEAVVEGVFDLDGRSDIAALLETWDSAPEDNQLIIRRRISRTGKNRVYLGDRAATLGMLEQIGGRLIDISGQYSQQLLLQADNHIDILDAYAGCLERRERYSAGYRGYRAQADELLRLSGDIRQALQRRDLLEYQQREIDAAALRVGEEEELHQEKNVLANAHKLYEKVYGVYAGLYENDPACLGELNRLKQDLADAAGIDGTLQAAREVFETAVLQLEDMCFGLRTYTESLSMDPARLDEIEARLDEMYRLKQKYGASIEAVLSHRHQVAQELDGIDVNADRCAVLQKSLDAARGELWAAAEELTQHRREAAARLQQRVEAELRAIGMPKAAFNVHMQSHARTDGDAAHDVALAGLTPHGRDTVEFYIATNQGEQPKPLSRVASGGEISRIVLALKKILAGNYRVGTLVFDEVDAGIGGAVADAVGGKLKEIARSHQVLCITHLPQIACYGDQHFSVRKTSRSGRTLTQVERLDGSGRLDELSRMLGGKTISDATREHARDMFHHAQRG
jgi:DNA repair protein RecN (Recombination protein N)